VAWPPRDLHASGSAAGSQALLLGEAEKSARSSQAEDILMRE
jgi:hypothetical protein